MEKFTTLLSQRRVWSSIIGAMTFLLSMANIEWNVDVEHLTDLVMGVVTGVGTLVTAGLALHSYIKPKPKP